VPRLIFRTLSPRRPPGTLLTVGEAAERLRQLGLEVSASQIRKLEREGLLKIPARTEGNYRVLDEESLKRIRLIEGLRWLGLSLPTIRQVVELLGRRTAATETERRELIEHLDGKIGTRIKRLKDLSSVLSEYHTGP